MVIVPHVFYPALWRIIDAKVKKGFARPPPMVINDKPMGNYEGQRIGWTAAPLCDFPLSRAAADCQRVLLTSPT